MQKDSKTTIKKNYLSILPYLTSKKSQSFFGIILTLCTVSFFGFFAISPVVSTIFKLQKEIKDDKFVLEQLETKIANLNKLKIQYASLESDLPLLINAIPPQPYPHLFFAQARSIAQAFNVSVYGLQNSTIEIVKHGNPPNNDYYSYSFTIDGSGSKENIYKFVKKITNMERIVSIDTFSIRNADAGAVTGQEIFSIQGKTFFKNNL
jgi:Tfp pilus assembly protein PilO